MVTASDVTFVVLGMHRSGTSALTRAVSLLGAQLPKKIMEANQFNAPGYWEPSSFVALNDEVLEKLDRHWADPKPMPEAWQDAGWIADKRLQAKGLLDQEFDRSGSIVVKDPRLSRLLPFWHPAFEQRTARPVYLIICRHPLEVAKSLLNRDKMELEHGLHLWASYMLDAELHTRGAHRLVVFYDELLKDWRHALSPMLKYTSIEDFETADPDLLRSIDAFLSPKHRHHSLRQQALGAETLVHAQAERVFEEYLRFDSDGSQTEFDNLRDEWRAFWHQESPGERRSNLVGQLPQVKFEESKTLEEQGELEAAFELVKHAAELVEDDVLYQLRLGHLAEKTGDLALAEKAFCNTLALNPKVAGASLSLSRLLEQRECISEASDVVADALRHHPENAALHFRRGVLLEQQSDIVGSAAAFDRALDLNKDMVGAYLGLARLREKREDVEGALEILETACARFSDNAPVHFQRGRMLEKTGDLDGSVEAFRAASTAKGSNPGMLLALARVLGQAQRHSEALEALSTGRERYPNNAPVQFHYGLSLEKSGDLAGAANVFRVAVGLHGSNAGMHLGLARVLKDQGMVSQAISALNNAKALYPDNAQVHRQLGLLLEHSGDLDEACGELRQSLELDDTATISHLALARIYRKQLKFEDAAAVLDTAISSHPTNTAFKFELGLLREQSSDLPGAAEALRQALALKENHVAYRVALARVLTKQGDPVSAIELLRDGLVRSSESAELMHELAVRLDEGGEFDEADELREEALRVDTILLDEVGVSLGIEGRQIKSSVAPPHLTSEQKQALIRCLCWSAAGELAKDAVILSEGGDLTEGAAAIWPLGRLRPEYETHPAIAPVTLKKRPLVSVMIPTYKVKSERWLRTCIDSVIAQDIAPEQIEIAIVDDSPEHSVAKSVAQTYGANVRYLPNSERLGLSANFTQCIQASSGEFVHILHQDDWVALGFYKALLEPLIHNPNLVAAFSKSEFVDEEDGIKSIDPGYADRAGPLHNWLDMIVFRLRLWFPAVLVRRSAYEITGGFCSSLQLAMDWDMWTRLSAAGPVWYEPHPYAKFRSHKGSETWRQLPVDRSIDLMRALVRNLSFLPLEKRSQLARAAFTFDLMNAARQMFGSDEFAQSTDSVLKLRELFLQRQTNERLAEMAHSTLFAHLTDHSL